MQLDELLDENFKKEVLYELGQLRSEVFATARDNMHLEDRIAMLENHCDVVQTDRHWISLKDAAKLIGANKKWLRQAIQYDEGPKHYEVGGKIMFRAADLIKFGDHYKKAFGQFSERTRVETEVSSQHRAFTSEDEAWQEKQVFKKSDEL